jgi:hypothetical protein
MVGRLCVIVGVVSFDYGVPDVFSSFFRSQAARVRPGFTAKTPFGGDIPRAVPITENVPVLRLDHRTLQGILFGVWKVIARSSPVRVR